MSITSGLVVFFISWWLVFFLLLPVGVKSPEESGEEVLPGNTPSAPVNPRLWTKAFFATIAAAVISYGVYLLVMSDIIVVRPAG